MKKILTLALVAALSATFTTASAKDKKECCKAKTECCKVDKKKNKRTSWQASSRAYMARAS